jgi:hypothetical protein
MGVKLNAETEYSTEAQRFFASSYFGSLPPFSSAETAAMASPLPFSLTMSTLCGEAHTRLQSQLEWTQIIRISKKA